MQTNISLSKEAESHLEQLRPIARRNGIRVSKKYLIEMALKIAVSRLDNVNEREIEKLLKQ